MDAKVSEGVPVLVQASPHDGDFHSSTPAHGVNIFNESVPREIVNKGELSVVDDLIVLDEPIRGNSSTTGSVNFEVSPDGRGKDCMMHGSSLRGDKGDSPVGIHGEEILPAHVANHEDRHSISPSIHMPALRRENTDYSPMPALRQENTDYVPMPALRRENTEYVPVPALRQENTDYIPMPALRQENTGYVPVPALRRENRYIHDPAFIRRQSETHFSPAHDEIYDDGEKLNGSGRPSVSSFLSMPAVRRSNACQSPSDKNGNHVDKPALRRETDRFLPLSNYGGGEMFSNEKKQLSRMATQALRREKDNNINIPALRRESEIHFPLPHQGYYEGGERLRENVRHSHLSSMPSPALRRDHDFQTSLPPHDHFDRGDGSWHDRLGILRSDDGAFRENPKGNHPGLRENNRTEVNDRRMTPVYIPEVNEFKTSPHQTFRPSHGQHSPPRTNQKRFRSFSKR